MVVVGHYQMGVVLGRGRFGWVSRATHHILGRRVAVKHQPWPAGGLACGGEAVQHRDCHHVEVKKCRAALENEAALLARVSHPAIVALLEVVRGPTGVYVCLEDLGDTNLNTLVLRQVEEEGTGLTETFTAIIFQQVAAGLQHLHDEGIVHRDIKPDNIMVVKGNKFASPVAKLIDLGLATPWGPSSPLNTANTRAGTVSFLAPELTQASHAYGPEVDVFSLGASMYFALVGDTPFTEYTRAGRRGTTAVYGLQLHHEDAMDTLSRHAGVVLRAMMDTCPKKRWSLARLVKHDWFKVTYTSTQPDEADYQHHNESSDFTCLSPRTVSSPTDVYRDTAFPCQPARPRPPLLRGCSDGQSSDSSDTDKDDDYIDACDDHRRPWVDMQTVNAVSVLLKQDLEDVLQQVWDEPWGPVGGMYNLLLTTTALPDEQHLDG